MTWARFVAAGLTVAGWLAATPASAETIKGTFTFNDFGGTATPIANAKVEVYRLRPGQIGWSMDFTAFTNATGSINVTVPFAGSGALTSLRVYADNPAVIVLRQDDPFQPFYQKPGFPAVETMFVSTSASDVFDFSFEFADEWSAAHYNPAQAIQIAKAYADARRDPLETDVIEQLHVQIQNNGMNTYFDPVSHRIRISVMNSLSDRTVIHEYAHYLEQKISSFLGEATWHDGCRFLSASPPWGVNVASAGLAWMEGFADYFSGAVERANPGTVTGGPYGDGTAPVADMETPGVKCSTTTPETVENFVAGALWDLFDNTPSEAGDRYCSPTVPTDTLIFQIFDRELGHLGNANPTLQNFLDAWSGRALDLPQLVSTFGFAATNLTQPASTHRYDPAAGAEIAIWRPSDGMWWVLWKNGTPNAQQWGEPTDIPVPADYDGDGVTDHAIWRPRDGNWWVILSKTNRQQATQWGAPTDIPLPADYDGDGEVDFAVYRPASGLVIVKNDNCGSDLYISVGTGTPVVGQFDSDRRADPGVYDYTTRTFTIQRTIGGPKSVTMNASALAGPALDDYDGDTKTDFAVFDSFAGLFSIVSNASGAASTTALGPPHFVLGSRRPNYASPVPADYDGDGRTDPAVFYGAEGMWHLQRSRDGLLIQPWGFAGDRPVPAR